MKTRRLDAMWQHACVCGNRCSGQWPAVWIVFQSRHVRAAPEKSSILKEVLFDEFYYAAKTSGHSNDCAAAFRGE